jgi:hypothetical protein
MNRFAPGQAGRNRSVNKSRFVAMAALLGSAGLLLADAPPGTTFEWDAVTNTAVSGYRLYWGTGRQFYTDVVDTGPATSVTLTGLSNGVPYFFAVAAYDPAGADGDLSEEITFTPGGTNLPTVRLSSPTNNSGYTEPAAIELVANVNPNAHTVNQVQFYEGATLLGAVFTPPYHLLWTNAGAGSYSLRAQATYDRSHIANSDVVNVDVANAGGNGPSLIVTITTDGEAVLTGAGLGRRTYDILATEDFSTWSVLGSVTADWTGAFTFTDTARSAFGIRIYRAREVAIPAQAGAVLSLRMTTDGKAQITGAGHSDVLYEILTTEDLNSWFILGSVTADGTGAFAFTDPESSSRPARFYRVRAAGP